MKQFRISVNGKFQFTVSSNDGPVVIANRAIATMKLSNARIFLAPGQINLVTSTL